MIGLPTAERPLTRTARGSPLAVLVILTGGWVAFHGGRAQRQGRAALVALAVLGLWYLPFGTLCNLWVPGAVGAGVRRAA